MISLIILYFSRIVQGEMEKFSQKVAKMEKIWYDMIVMKRGEEPLK